MSAPSRTDETKQCAQWRLQRSVIWSSALRPGAISRRPEVARRRHALLGDPATGQGGSLRRPRFRRDRHLALIGTGCSHSERSRPAREEAACGSSNRCIDETGPLPCHPEPKDGIDRNPLPPASAHLVRTRPYAGLRGSGGPAWAPATAPICMAGRGAEGHDAQHRCCFGIACWLHPPVARAATRRRHRADRDEQRYRHSAAR